MVLMKKGATPKKKQFKKGKTPLKSKSDVGDSGDKSDKAPQLQRTSTGMTPEKGSSILAEKQPTPAGKFKGMKRKMEQEEAEDSEDDEDVDLVPSDEADGLSMDDEEEEDEGEEDGLSIDDEEEEDEGEEDDLSMDGDDKEEEDEEDVLSMDDDKEEKDEKDDEKDGDILKERQLKHFERINADEKKRTERIEENRARADERRSTLLAKLEALKATEDRREERESKMIWVGQLPADVTKDELKNLSKDIVQVFMPVSKSRKHFTKFAFIVFNSKAEADSNFEALKSKTLRGQLLTIDFVSRISKEASKKPVEDYLDDIDIRRLYVVGIPHDTTIGQLTGYFEKAQSIEFSLSPKPRYAYISFFTCEDAKEAFEANKEIEISGENYTVLYSCFPERHCQNPLHSAYFESNRNHPQHSTYGGYRRNPQHSTYGGYRPYPQHSTYGGYRPYPQHSTYGGYRRNPQHRFPNGGNRFFKKMKFSK